ncbi:MAG: glycerol-3-phosphate acyltransferase, partial [Eubacteriales bacterium]
TIVLMLDWRLFIILFAIFVILVAGTKYISAGSVICAMLYPLILNRMNDTGLRLIEFIALAIMLIVVIKHKDNIKRIFNGTESKFQIKKSKAADADNKD